MLPSLQVHRSMKWPEHRVGLLLLVTLSELDGVSLAQSLVCKEVESNRLISLIWIPGVNEICRVRVEIKSVFYYAWIFREMSSLHNLLYYFY